MKIKCPLCKKEYFSIYSHLRIEHNNQEVALMFGSLLTDIHKNIEFHKGLEEHNNLSVFSTLEVLKSLLENEK